MNKITTKKISKKEIFTISSAILLIGAALFSTQVKAADSTTNFTSSATLSDSCRFRLANPVRFNSFVPKENGNDESRGFIVLTCTKGTNFVLSFGPGLSGNQLDRKMTALNMNGVNTDKLDYSIRYIDMEPSVDGLLVGDGSQGTATYSSTGYGDGIDNSIFINVILPQNQFVKPDNYYDNITLTVTY